jgi:hypothetical protein
MVFSGRKAVLRQKENRRGDLSDIRTFFEGVRGKNPACPLYVTGRLERDVG